MDITNIDPSTPIVRFFATTGINIYKQKKREKILDALSKGLLHVDSHQLQSDEFISAYLTTESALIKASSQCKFDFLLNLFIQGSNSGRINKEPDAYQETLSIVNELSERELTILYHLYNYERDHGHMDQQLAIPGDHQVDYLIDNTRLEREMIVALLVRLRRTGLIITFSEKKVLRDLMISGIEIMFISPIADEIKAWIFHVIEGSFSIRQY
ncbi:hypothetical protein [Aeromonas rivipollensis]|uniref:hypothetical protein n=1 Tax=Aeromonas rivipollensis TaxID=948519 RepID=UPI0027D98808|nr:hypothetical protein [uncultured Aeromonas sp.]MDU1141870.1 hypothetical protein [Aeromonas hydrophila]